MTRDPLFSSQVARSSNLVERLRHWADVQTDQTAFYYTDDVETDQRITYAELDERVRAVAVRLREAGAGGRRVLLLYPPGLDFVVGFFGCLFAGAVAVPAYPPRRNRNMERIQAICSDADAAIALTVQEVADRVDGMLSETPDLRELQWVATDQMGIDGADQWQMPHLASDSMAVLQYTSGSTGSPKGVVLTHGNLMHNCALIYCGFDPSPDCVGLTWLPTFHDMGLVGGVLKPMFFGRPNVLMSPMAFLQKPVRWLRGITRYGVSISGGPNFSYALCTDKITEEECEDLDLSSWEVAFNGAEPVRAETLRRFTEKFAPYGFQAETHYPCYGMAETTLIVTGGFRREETTVRKFDAELLERHTVQHAKAGSDAKVCELVSCGRVLPEMELIIVDPDTKVQLEPGQVGEIWVAGPSVGRCYWNKPDETARTFQAQLKGQDKHYLRTGDLGFLDDGQLYVTGRCKDLIIIRGRNLYPQDIEKNAEKCHPALRAGGSAVFSVDVGNQEELVVAQEVERHYRRHDLNEVLDAIRQTIVEQHDVLPYSILLLNAGKLPKTSSGKVQRTACRAEYLAGSLEVVDRWSSTQTASGVQTSVASMPSPNASSNAIQSWLAGRIAQEMQVDPDTIDVHESFARFGLDSVALVGISGELEEWLGQSVSPTLLYSYPTIRSLSDFLVTELVAPHDANGHADAAEAGRQAEPIAIVGVGCRFPSAADPDAFWELLRNGGDAIREIGNDRWDVDALYSPDPDAPGKMYARHAGLLDQVDQFDPQFFGIAPREAITIDPQQRLLLEVAWEALEHGGISPDRLADHATGIFVGISNSDYGRLQSRGGDLGAVDAHTGTGTLTSIAAGRLSYFLGVHGPTMAVDTACSSSLVAVHLAVQSLRSGECRTALAGGVNLILEPSSMVALSKLRALSPDGRCKTFDESADGYGRGEGCGVVVLKRLADALEDGDRVLALVRGSAVNHDGHSNGLTAPHGPSQEALIQTALADGGIAPDWVTYLEAHGTGTSLGDPIEIRAAANVYGQNRSSENPLAIGSVKTNVGHLESAAGMASLIKVVLSLQHSQIPPHLHLHRPNPYIPWDELNLDVPTELVPWIQNKGRRLAGISSFGFSGTNAHLILEGVTDPQPSPTEADRPQHVLTVSAKDRTALQELCRSYADFMANEPASLADVCHTANAGRANLAHRVAIQDSDKDRVRASLLAVAEGKQAPNCIRSDPKETSLPRLAMLFTGQGAQYRGMGRKLYETQPTFRDALDECDEFLRDSLPHRLLDVLYAPHLAPDVLNQTAFTQPALFAIEYALYELWKSWGVTPDVVLGHSVGEYVAAAAAGVMSLRDSLTLIAARGRLMQSMPEGGTMLAVMAEHDRVARLLESYPADKVSVAAINGPRQTVISGEAAVLQQIAAHFEKFNVASKQLAVSHAFHSPLMDPILDEFEAVCRGIQFKQPLIPVASNVHGRLVTDEIASPQYWREQIRQTVHFSDAMQALHKDGANVFLELGPKPILTMAGRQCLSEQQSLWLASLREGREDWSEILHSVAQLYARGVPIDWAGFDRDYHRRRVNLPTYPFQRQRYWLDKVPGVSARTSTSGDRMGDWFFDLQWHPRSRKDQALQRQPARFLPSPEVLAESVEPEVQRIQSQLTLPRYQDLDRDLDRLSAAYVRQALDQLGWQPQPGEIVDADQLADQLGIVRTQRRLFGRLLGIMADEGRLGLNEDQWEVADRFPPVPDPQMIWSLVAPKFPECAAELTLLRQCGDQLACVLRGATDPLHVLFPGGSAEAVERLYKDSPFARALNTLVEETLIQSVRQLPERGTIKILEIGAGTGGTTAQLLPRLPVERTEYMFTDVSELFTKTAREKFRQYPFIEYAALDIERSPVEQGFAEHQYDLILAANVIHATQDLRVSLANVQKLLTPGGQLVLLESTRRQRWLDLVFGLTDGWWRFSDTDLRPHHALLSPTRWVELLTDCGFDSAVALPEFVDPKQGRDAPPNAVLVAQAATEPIPVPASSNLPDAPATNGAEAPWLILSDRGGVGDALAAAFAQRGEPSVQVYAGEEFDQVGAAEYLVNPQSVEDLAALMRSIWSGPPACRGVVHLWSLDAARQAELTPAHLLDAQHLGSASVPKLLQQMSRLPWNEPPRVWIGTTGAQAVGPHREVPGLAQSPVWGIGRVLSEELPAFWGGLVDLDPQAAPERSAECLLDELLQSDGEDQVAYREEQRYAARLVPHPPQAAGQPLRWRSDASYLITGGLGDLGLKVAQWMVDRGARTLVLTTRQDFPLRQEWEAAAESSARRAAQIKALRRLESQGAEVLVVQADVADADSMQQMVTRLQENGKPPFRGVVHCAGLAEAGPLLELDDEQLHRVLQPKLTGTWVLHRLFLRQRLDFFVNFSSGAALLGSPMLGSYAAANAFLDAITHDRRARGLAGLSVNWGFWDEVGMVARSQREIGRGFAPQGMQSFSPAQGLAAMETLLQQDAVQTAVMPVDWPSWCQAHPRASRSPLLANLLNLDADAETVGETLDEAPSLTRALLEQVPLDERPEVVDAYLAEQLGRVLRIPAEDLDVNQPLNNLGIDSLMAVELRNHVQAHLGVSIPVAQLLQDPTIRQLSGAVLDQLASSETWLELKPEASVQSAEENELSANQALTQLDDLSDDEVEAMLSQMLNTNEGGK